MATINSITIGSEVTHPEYTPEIAQEWRLMRDAYRGEVAIKKRGETYLRKLDGWSMKADKGSSKYETFIFNARFPEIVSNAIRSMVGIAHSQDWQIELPAALEPLRENSDGRGLPIENLSRRITTELLITGRYALLADAPADGGDIYLAGYTAEQLVNWSEDDDFYTLVELRYRRDGEVYTSVTHKRVLELVDGRYLQKVYDDSELVEEYEPSVRGGRALDMIPIAVGGAMDRDLTPDTPPLIGVARAAWSHYQLYALYRNALELGVSSTLVGVDIADPPKAIGTGLYVGIQSKQDNKQGDLKYVTPDALEIDGLVTAMDREQQSAIRSGAQMFDNTPRGQESGEARRLRFSAETATLSSVVNSSGAIMESALKQAAIMAGANPDEVVVAPPQNLLEGRLDAGEIQALVNAWERGAFGYSTLYENLQRGRIASPERTYEDEEREIDRDLPDIAPGDTV